MSFSFKDRQDILASLSAEAPELVVIGGGIVGCSVAAHAARLGLDVLLLEKNDIASGASGNSTGLAHAGLRYLAQGRLGYVFSEGRERHRLQELAPHWVQPFNFLLPVYKEDPYAFWMIRIGTMLYDALGWLDALVTKRSLVKRHQVLSAEAVKAKIPGIRSENLLGGIEYYVDARLQDARFTLGYAQQAAQHGARILTHCEVKSVLGSGGVRNKVEARDLLSGQSLSLTTLLVINATGAWLDEVRHESGLTTNLVQKSKGVHLIVDHITDTPLIMSASEKGKVFFVIPIDSDRTLVGTTDTAVNGAPDDVRVESNDVMELVQQLFLYFPYLKQGPNMIEAIEGYKKTHVRDLYWGIRPLLAQKGSTLSASREHRLVKDWPHYWSFPGVKLTAGRAAGYEAAIDAWKYLRNGAALPAVTWDCLPGGELWDFDRFVREAQKRFKLGTDSAEVMKYLVSMYGTRYVEVMKWAQREPGYSEPIVPEEPWILAQAAYAVHEEMVLTLNDLLWRRTKWAHYRDLPDAAIQKITEVLGNYLSWSEDERKKQILEYQAELKKHRL